MATQIGNEKPKRPANVVVASSLSNGSVQGGTITIQIRTATTMQAPVRAKGGNSVGNLAARITDQA